MRIYKVNDKLVINLDKVVALEEIMGSYKLVMVGNTILNIGKQEYLKLIQELEYENDSDIFQAMGIDDKPMLEQLENAFGLGNESNK